MPEDVQDLTSPQRRELLSDYHARKALDRFKTKVGEKVGVYVPDEASWNTDDAKTKIIAVVKFEVEPAKTVMRMMTREGSDFFEKTLSEHNVESATVFAKNAVRIIDSINAMY